jgi:hypothetical protein
MSFSQSLEPVEQPNPSYSELLDSAWDIFITARIKNVSSQDLNIKVKTAVISLTNGHTYDVCWNDNCSPATISNWEQSKAYTLPAGAETPSSLFFSHYYAFDQMGTPVEGSGTIKYTFYVVENPQDNLSFEVTYNFTTSSVFEAVSNSNLNVNFLDNKILRVVSNEQSSSQYTISIYSLQGTKIVQAQFNDYYEKDFSNFGNQVFLFQITQNGKIISSGKIE